MSKPLLGAIVGGILGILDRYLAERRTKAASALRAVAKSRLETAP